MKAVLARRLASQFWIPAFAGMTALVGLFIAPLHAESTEGLLKKADTAWQKREDPQQTREAIQRWKQALEQDPKHTELYYRLAKASGRAYRDSSVSKERKSWAAQGLQYAKQAIRSEPQKPEALAAYAEALGQSAQANKGPSGLKNVKLAVKALNQAIEIQPRYAYAHMMLSNFYRQAPRVISIGNLDKALEHARLAVEYDPHAGINHVTLAEALIENNKKDEAKVELEKALNVTHSPDRLPENKSDQEKARKLLQSLRGMQ